MEQAQFRIGGVYRQRNGVVAKLFAHGRTVLAERVWSPPGEWLDAGGARDLSTGRYFCRPNEDDEITLLPGELHQVNGEWVPVEEKKEEPQRIETLGDLLKEALRRGIGQQPVKADPNAAMIARDVPKHITENGVVKVRASDVLKTDQAKKQIAAVKALRTALPANPALSRMSGGDHKLGASWKR